MKTTLLTLPVILPDDVPIENAVMRLNKVLAATLTHVAFEVGQIRPTPNKMEAIKTYATERRDAAQQEWDDAEQEDALYLCGQRDAFDEILRFVNSVEAI